ncbi:MAG: N-formyl-4-amino-5-aminomethyl-2-methylpyrimidine deformylase [Bacteroidetes bacterium ADurb.Bin234]|nr:MAG: N-formyl-4-amino-5-aminomethyl-2-methylpyrimidine deformylase [Bacteroidetes bacterium ADurb.Bin234]
MKDIKTYIEANKDRFLKELFELIHIPSISSLSDHKPDMLRCAELWKKFLLEAGVDRCNIMPTAGNPVVYAEKTIGADKPTVLVYAHYDVMPVDPVELWNSPPFEAEIRDGKIWARGADDDKGQSFMHAKAFEFMVKTNQLPCNVKFMFEGEEEIGSPNLYEFCRTHKDLLKADVILVSDTGMLASDVPSITTGLRGLSYWQVKVTGANRDLHSGLYGGAVANPINILCEMIAGMMDENRHITIPHFYDDVVEVSDYERELMAKAPFNLEAYKKELDIDEVCGEKGYATHERTGIRPTFDICGIWGGYTGEGAKTVIPSEAHAKISTRLVPNQDYQKIGRQFVDYFNSIAPSCVKVEVEFLHGGDSYVAPINLPAYKAAEKAFEATYGKLPIPTRSGGSIPIIAGFEKILGIKSILMGFGLGSDAIHSPNENYPLNHFFKGIETIPYFYKYFTEMMK